MTEPLAVPSSTRAIDEAALALHDPTLTPGAILELLVQLVADLGLATDVALLLPAEQPRPPDPGVLRTEVREPARASGNGDAPRRRLIALLECRPRSADMVRALEVLSAHAGVAVTHAERMREIARREESVRRIAERLQDALLPPLPELPNTGIEVRYRAASREARVGGDFYDVFPLPNDCVLIVVGDVVGKGVEAASRTSRITQTLRALALQGMALEEMLERCDAQITFQDPEIMATIWCGLYQPSSGELVFASLGHPPALLLRGTSPEAVRLELEGLPLGMRDLTTDPPDCRNRRLESRDLLVLYTDGVVESSRDFLAGQQSLLDAIEKRRNEPLSTILDVALDELLASGGHADDAVMLLLRRR